MEEAVAFPGADAPSPLTGVYKNMTQGIVALVSRCRLASGPEPYPDEAEQISWVSLEGLERRVEEVYAVRIFDAIDTEEASIRAHYGARMQGTKKC